MASHSGDTLRMAVGRVTGVADFAKKLTFGQVTDVNADTRVITIQMRAPADKQ